MSKASGQWTERLPGLQKTSAHKQVAISSIRLGTRSQKLSTSPVLCSEESKFDVGNHSGNSFLRRRSGEEWKPECFDQPLQHTSCVMMLGYMAGSGVGFSRNVRES